ncbi:Hpt domain-containing protein [Pricia sp. S334]|uniref:Hpt domain-containing protein n=1 Tax=Pricia mediterranea TaxID=3076079 RepID=A0ABU3LBZ8_9FLAO|nr:Hpt domain-containing protein [Pricia sp. S334]MDT7830592.1 Hpt domain-containing protein [Pricia sp. S334]
MKTKHFTNLQHRFETSQQQLITTDLEPILGECMGEMSLLRELISLFRLNALEFIGAARIHLDNTDFKALALAAHKIKAGLAMMRTDSLHAIVCLIEKECCGDQDPKHLQFLYDCFVDEFPSVETSIEVALAQLDQ